MFILLEDLVRPNLYWFSISETNVKIQYQQFIGQNSKKNFFVADLSVHWIMNWIGSWIKLKLLDVGYTKVE